MSSLFVDNIVDKPIDISIFLYIVTSLLCVKAVIVYLIFA